MRPLRERREWYDLLDTLDGGMTSTSRQRFRTEAKAPFRATRTVVFGGLSVGAGIGLLIITAQLVAALRGVTSGPDLRSAAQNFAINLAAVALFVGLTVREVRARGQDKTKVAREEELGRLQARLYRLGLCCCCCDRTKVARAQELGRLQARARTLVCGVAPLLGQGRRGDSCLPRGAAVAARSCNNIGAFTCALFWRGLTMRGGAQDKSSTAPATGESNSTVSLLYTVAAGAVEPGQGGAAVAPPGPPPAAHPGRRPRLRQQGPASRGEAQEGAAGARRRACASQRWIPACIVPVGVRRRRRAAV